MRSLITFLLSALVATSPMLNAEEKQSTNEKIPEIRTREGKTFYEVEVRSRKGNKIRIMHRDGIKTVSFDDLHPESAALLGIDEYRAEEANQLKEEAQKKVESLQQEAFVAVRRVLDIRERFLRSPKLTANDWCLIFCFKGGVGTPDYLKREVFMRPPTYSTTTSWAWPNMGWDPVSDKMSEVWVRKKVINGQSRLVFSCGAREMDTITGSKMRAAFDEESRKIFQTDPEAVRQVWAESERIVEESEGG